MASIRINSFSGIRPKISAKLLQNNEAQIAENVRLRDGKLRPSFGWAETQAGNFVGLRDTLFGVIGSPSSNPVYTYARSNDLCLSSQSVNGSNIFEYLADFGNVFKPVPVYDFASIPPNSSWAAVVSETRTRTFITNTPTVRAYALTVMTAQGESPPVLLDVENGGSNTPFFEGDILTLSCAIRDDVASVANYINVYRTVSKPRTGEQVEYDLLNDFLLVREVSMGELSAPVSGIRTFSFIDSYSDRSLQHKAITSSEYAAPKGVFTSIGKLNNGRYWAIRVDPNTGSTQYNTVLQVSSVFSKYVWPKDAAIVLSPHNLPNLERFRAASVSTTYVTDAVSYRDNVIVGTSYKPLIVSVSDSASSSSMLDFIELDIDQPCVPNTLCSTPFGAIYTSYSGVVIVNQNAASVFSSELFEFGADLWTPSYRKMPQYAYYWDGRYYIVGLLNSTTGLCVQINKEEHTVDFGQVSTFTHPAVTRPPVKRPFCALPQPSGVYCVFDEGVYETHRNAGFSSAMARPAVLSTFKWRSKKFVMPGPTAFSAAKIVHDGSGQLVMNLYVDGRLAYNREVSHSKPFRLPRSRKGIEWEIELCGQSVVEEIHLATSTEELTESYNNDAQ